MCLPDGLTSFGAIEPCGDHLLAVQEIPVNQWVTAVWFTYEAVFLCLDGLKFVWCY